MSVAPGRPKQARTAAREGEGTPVSAAGVWRVIRWLALPWVVWLAGCASPALAPGSDRETFSRSGRFAVVVEQAAQDTQAVQGGFLWRDEGRRLTIDLSNPFGSVLARIQIEPGRAELTRSDGSREIADSPDALLAQVVGQALPVAGLRDWLQGRHAGAAQVKTDSEGRLASLSQLGWQVQLSRYDAQGPTLLQLARSDGGQQVRVRLALDRR